MRHPDSFSRRHLLVASTMGLAGMRFGIPSLASPIQDPTSLTNGPKAKSTILFFLCGGSSHIDMWDLKPKAPQEYRGEFQPISTSSSGLQISEHLPRMAKLGHHLAVVRSIRGTVNTNDHHAGYYYNLTGHVPDPTFLTLGNDRRPMPDDWPYMGCVVGSRRPAHPDLPNAITVPYKPSQLPYTRPGQFAARLGIEHDPMYVLADRSKPLQFQAPALTLEGDVSADRLMNRDRILGMIDSARHDLETKARIQTWSKLQHQAMRLLSGGGATKAFDLSGESEATLSRYGKTINGMSLLVARRLVEAQVPFITVFWAATDENLAKKCKSGGGWDTHGNNFNCLKENLLPEFDQCFSALVEDLQQRGMLDETLLVVTSEMGRKPKVGDPRSGGKTGAGRDHWTHCQSVILAGGGIRGGQAYGTTDKYGEYPEEKPITPAHIAHSVYHAMGINQLEATDKDGRTFNLLAEGEPLYELF
ncbi:MAG: hypothetical protein RJA81_1336 [Planctomycetota bacterium]